MDEMMKKMKQIMNDQMQQKEDAKIIRQAKLFHDTLKAESQSIPPQSSPSSVPPEIFNTTSELAEYLRPFNISKSTIYKWIMKSKRKLMNFPFHKGGRRLFFYRSEIEKWLSKR